MAQINLDFSIGHNENTRLSFPKCLIVQGFILHQIHSDNVQQS
jgi:hypothetical protein